MIGLKIDAAKNLFFDRAAVDRAVDRGTKRVLSRFGSFVRTAGRDLTNKPARRQRVSEMTDEERANHKRAVAIAKREGRPAPKRRRVSSRPGEPPRKITGLLRRFIFFVYDPSRRSVVVGPALLNGKKGSAPSTLEHGGTATIRSRSVHVAARPFMAPALDRELPKLPAMWRDAIR